FAAAPSRIIRLDLGGLSWHGALLGGVVTGWLVLRRSDINFGAALDLIIPGLTVGYTLVRIANILNQEILGRHAELLGTRHPTQLYGSAIGLILLIRYFVVNRRRTPDGYQFWSFVLWYSILRAVIEETFRANPLYALGYINQHWGVGLFTLTQLVTPPILLVAWYFLNRILRDDSSRP
ncbi:MAG: prolipoprotein diacylglyceryl transferase, partial [Bacillota bacterium]